MNKIKIVLLVSCLIFFNIFAISQDSLAIEKIKDNTGMTAKNTSKGWIEHISVYSSIFGALFALVTLIYSYKTYNSQKKTERNTRRWSVKQERMLLRQIAWKLFKTYNNLITIEKLIQNGQIPSIDNYEKMKIDISELHLNEAFDSEINYDNLYSIYNKIKEFNYMLGSRYDQFKYKIVKRRDYLWGSDEIMKSYEDNYQIVFLDEKICIRDILYMIDKFYPSLHGKNKSKESNKEKIEIVKNIGLVGDENSLFGFNPLERKYESRSGITIDDCNDTLLIEEADKYFPVPFICFYNRVLNRLREIGDLTEIDNSKLLDVNKSTDNNFCLPLVPDYIDIILHLVYNELSKSHSVASSNIYFSPDTDEQEEDEDYYDKNKMDDSLFNLYDPVTKTLFLYINKNDFNKIIRRRTNNYIYYITENDLPIFFVYSEGKIKCIDGVSDRSYNGCIEYYKIAKNIPYYKNQIEHITFSYINESGCDKASFRVSKIKYSLAKDKKVWKASIHIDNFENFERK